MNDLDVSDFNKARSFLLAWSILVFCLWFFGADLTAFKLLGNEIKLTKNVSEVWLLLGCANAYLWFRYLQMVPKGGFNFDGDMNEVYDDVLRWWVAIRLVFFDRWRIKYQQHKLNGFKVKIYRSSAVMRRFNVVSKGAAVPPYRLNLPDRAAMDVSYLYQITQEKGGTIEGWGFGSGVQPNAFLAAALKVVAFVKGIFVVPWFTTYLLPVLVGSGATVLAIDQWWLINS